LEPGRITGRIAALSVTATGIATWHPDILDPTALQGWNHEKLNHGGLDQEFRAEKFLSSAV
jgi:hypothetical protein